MKARTLLATPALCAATALAPALAHAETVQVSQISHVSDLVGKLHVVTVDGQQGVQVDGPGTPVRLDFASATSKAGQGSALSLAKVGIRHLDRGAHSFDVALGGPLLLSNDAPARLIDNSAPVASAKILCDAMAPGSGRGPSATIMPQFAGSAGFSVVVVKAGKTLQSTRNQRGAFTIPSFDTVHDGHLETLGVTFGFGLERKGSWSIRIEHDDFVVTITAESPQPAIGGTGHLRMSTSGLESVTLLGHRIETAEPGKILAR